jgi:hypothetical protein
MPQDLGLRGVMVILRPVGRGLARGNHDRGQPRDTIPRSVTAPLSWHPGVLLSYLTSMSSE